MPLYDHFRPPLSERRHWQSFYHAWATYIAGGLNRLLPPDCFAEPNVRFGERSPLASTSTAIMTLIDLVEVQVISGSQPAARIELVSASNKEPAGRAALLRKCATCLHSGLGLVIVDVVTEYSANLHQELMELVASTSPDATPATLYAAAYHPTKRDGQVYLDAWPQALRVGDPLPTLPLVIRDGPTLPLDLEESYQRTCSELRIA